MLSQSAVDQETIERLLERLGLWVSLGSYDATVNSLRCRRLGDMKGDGNE
jgi:hypothetical protein